MNKVTTCFFSLDFNGKLVLESESCLLVDRLALINDDEVTDVIDFLKSPFLVKNLHLCSLFEHVYARYSRGYKRLVKQQFVKKNYQYSTFNKTKYKLRDHILELSEALLMFRAFKEVVNRPEELYRLKVQALRNKESIEQYQSELIKWETAIKALPIGIDKLYQQWQHADASYFALQVNPKEVKQNIANAPLDFFQDYTKTQIAIYEIEQMTRAQILNEPYSEKKLDNDKVENVSDSSSTFVSFFQELSILWKESTYWVQQFQVCQKYLFDYASTWDLPFQQMSWQLLFNYINHHRRLGELALNYELVNLVRFYLDQRLFIGLHYIPKELFLNHLMSAYIGGDFQLAEQVHGDLSPLLLLKDKELVLAHAQIAHYFYSHKYELVISLLGVHFEKYSLDVIVDAPRLKSFRLRSFLCLMGKNHWKYWEDFEKARQDFEKFGQRNLSKLSASQNANYRSFYSAIRRIGNALGSDSLDQRCEYIKEFILQTPNMHSKYWLVNYLDEYKKRKPRHNEIFKPNVLPGTARSF